MVPHRWLFLLIHFLKIVRGTVGVVGLLNITMIERVVHLKHFQSQLRILAWVIPTKPFVCPDNVWRNVPNE